MVYSIMSPCFLAANSKIRSVTWGLSYHAMWRDYAKEPHSQHDISRHTDKFAAALAQVKNGYGNEVLSSVLVILIANTDQDRYVDRNGCRLDASVSRHLS